MQKKGNVARDCAFPVLRDTFFRHSAALSLTAVLLRKVPINYLGRWRGLFESKVSFPRTQRIDSQSGLYQERSIRRRAQ